MSRLRGCRPTGGREVSAHRSTGDFGGRCPAGAWETTARWTTALVVAALLVACGDSAGSSRVGPPADASPAPAGDLGLTDAAGGSVAPDLALLVPDWGPPSPRDAGPDLPPSGPPDPTDAAFDPGRVAHIEIELDPADWDALRLQSRSLLDIIGSGCLDAPAESPFGWYPATVTLHGVRLEGVGVRKKGFLGSLSESKPSLKLDFDEFTDGQRYLGLERMTLNNDQQDPAHVRQCLGYDVFRTAGLPSPRCGFAEVTVNGVPLGVYSHVESVKKAFLRRTFGTDDGHLYEGALSDFRPGWTGTFARQTDADQDDGDRTDLDAVVEALQAEDADVVEQLEPVVNLDRFLTYWAAEALVGHWDGYSSNRNNFYLYADPADAGRFAFIPWGIDGIMIPPGSPAGHRGHAESVYATGLLAWRLYALPDLRSRYQDRLRWLLGHVWDEDHLLAEIDRMAALVEPHLTAEERAARPDALEAVRRFVRSRFYDLHTELALGPPEPPYPPEDAPCWEERGTVTASFDTVWGSYPFRELRTSGEGLVEVQLDNGEAWRLEIGAGVGVEPEGPDQGLGTILLLARLDAGRLVALQVLLRPELIAPGPVSLDWTDTQALLFVIQESTGEAALLGLVAGGELEFIQAGQAAGAPVEGVLTGRLLMPPG